jgi:dihydropteroate synthase
MRVMGIVNATPDSFWSGSRYETTERAIAAGRRAFESGAWAVDVGGESTRPGAEPVSVDEELDRIAPVVSALAGLGRVSVDTRHAEVAEVAVREGACLINDVSGTLHAVAARLGAGYIGMHAHTVPVLRDVFPVYDDVHADVAGYLQSLAAARRDGVEEMWIGRDVGDRLAGSLAMIAPAWSAGVDLIRVHDVPETLDTIALLDAVWGRDRPA